MKQTEVKTVRRLSKTTLAAIKELKFDSFKRFKSYGKSAQIAFLDRIVELSKTGGVELKPVTGKPVGIPTVKPAPDSGINEPGVIVIVKDGGVVVVIVVGPKRRFPNNPAGPCFEEIVKDVSSISKTNVSKDHVLLDLVDKKGFNASIQIFNKPR